MRVLYIVLIAIPIILIGAWLDNVLVGSFTFKNYLLICFIEALMFGIGVYVGYSYKLRNP